MQVRQAVPGDGPLLCAAGLSGRFDALVLEKDGIAIGAALREGAWVQRLYIVPEWRRRGYGTFLLRRVCRAGPRGLWARAENGAAPGVFAQCGFQGAGPVLCRGVRAAAGNAVACAHAFVRAHLVPGGFAVDATAGNGHDTVFLCHAVGPQGRVLALDIQQKAVDATNMRLQKMGLAQIGRAIKADHAGLADIFEKEGRPCAVMFNLGYLPGGSHAVFTTPQHSLPALDAAWPGPFAGRRADRVCVFRRHAGHGRARRGAGLGRVPCAGRAARWQCICSGTRPAAAHSGVPSERDAAGALSAPRAAFTLFSLGYDISFTLAGYDDTRTKG